MLFSSVTFLCFFLPIVIALYHVIPARFSIRGRNALLLCASVFFYAWGEPRHVALILFMTFAGWLTGLLMTARKRGEKKPRFWLAVCVILLLGSLGYFKYADFIVTNINLLPWVNIPLPRVILPVGISFYTFQILSYSIDLYRGRTETQYNFFRFATYVTLFPQLIAGPIVRYSEIERELTERKRTLSGFAEGVRRFTAGLAKKVLIANILAEFNAAVCPLDGVLASWLYVLSYGLFIYFDFSGYSDMAIGLGGIFGFSFPENFNYPFISRSITEFWRRWHISLSQWFRDYVYILHSR